MGAPSLTRSAAEDGKGGKPPQPSRQPADRWLRQPR